MQITVCDFVRRLSQVLITAMNFALTMMAIAMFGSLEETKQALGGDKFDEAVMNLTKHPNREVRSVFLFLSIFPVTQRKILRTSRLCQKSWRECSLKVYARSPIVIKTVSRIVREQGSNRLQKPFLRLYYVYADPWTRFFFLTAIGQVPFGAQWTFFSGGAMFFSFSFSRFALQDFGHKRDILRILRCVYNTYRPNWRWRESQYSKLHTQHPDTKFHPFATTF